MTPIALLTKLLIDGGLPADLIAQAIDLAQQHAIESAPHSGGNSGGIPVEIPVDKTAEKRREWDRNRKRNSGGIPVESGGNPVEFHRKAPKTHIIEDSNTKKDISRASRIPPEWTPPEGSRSWALQQGLSEQEVSREAARFRDYWIAKAGKDGAKLNWEATWRNWVRNTAERLGRSPLVSPSNGKAGDMAGKYHAAAGSPQIEAWDKHRIATEGKIYPRDKSGGWWFESEWPPQNVSHVSAVLAGQHEKT